MVQKRVSRLPLSLAPRGLSRVQAAEYIGVGATKFDETVDDGRTQTKADRFLVEDVDRYGNVRIYFRRKG